MIMKLWRRKGKHSGSAASSGKGGRRRWRLRILAGFVGLLAAFYVIGLLLNYAGGEIKGMNVESRPMRVGAENLQLLFDLTGVDAEGERVTDHEIFDTLLEMIEEAEKQIVLDMFLVNRFRGRDPVSFHRDISKELVDALVERKEENPELFILFLTDPINSGYKTACPPVLEPLKKAGGHVVLTDLRQLPDSNLVYSPFYRVLRHFNFLLGPMMDLQFIPHPFDAEKENFTLRQFSRMLNFKANHRKVAAVQREDGSWRVLVSSGNPHSASSAHGNLAVTLENEGPIQDIVFSEYNLARASLLRRPELHFGPGSAFELVRELERRVREWPAIPQPTEGGDRVTVQYLSEQKTGRRVERMLVTAEEGDRIEIMMFYFSDPDLIAELKAAVERGAEVRLLLDPNQDAFGREKHGVPNRVTAERLHEWAADSPELDLQIRWFDTHGEQAHFKGIRVFEQAGTGEKMLIGSANLTIRNLRGQNLESALYLENGQDIGKRYGQVFERLWNNQGDVHYTCEYETYSEDGWTLGFKRVMKLIGNSTGLCTY